MSVLVFLFLLFVVTSWELFYESGFEAGYAKAMNDLGKDEQ